MKRADGSKRSSISSGSTVISGRFASSSPILPGYASWKGATTRRAPSSGRHCRCCRVFAIGEEWAGADRGGAGSRSRPRATSGLALRCRGGAARKRRTKDRTADGQPAHALPDSSRTDEVVANSSQRHPADCRLCRKEVFESPRGTAVTAVRWAPVFGTVRGLRASLSKQTRRGSLRFWSRHRVPKCQPS
jgi:hypothetical protein